MARAYFYVVDQGPYWTVRYERRNYNTFSTEAGAYCQAMQWARDQGKDGHDAQVFARRANGKYRVCWSSVRDPYPTGVPSIPPDDAMAAPAKLPLLAMLTLALALSAGAASAADALSGTLRICRQTAIVDGNAGKPITIPSGATFVDNSTMSTSILKIAPAGDAAPRLRVATTAAVQIGANAACATAPARISRNDAGAAVRVGDGQRLSAARGAGGEPVGWPGNFYLDATIVTDFR